MSVISPNDQIHETRFNEDDYPVWKEAFSSQSRHAMIDEDVMAGQSVTLLLGALISVGAVLAIVSLLIISNM